MAGPSIESRLHQTARRASTFLVIEGIVLLVLGFLAIVLPMVAGIAVTIFLGWLLVMGGIVGLISTFGARPMPGFVWSLISAVLALAAGVLLIGWPGQGLVSVTLVLIVFFLADGLTSVWFAVSHRAALGSRWGWMLASGLVTLVLAIVILSGLPGSAAWALGLIVGIDMVMAGSSLVAIGTSLRPAA
jgi:uncharacterized membrane protein HdeD (DUF308 family)